MDEINRAGYRIDGQLVALEIVAVDDHSSAETGKQVAQQLVDAGVVAVIGHLQSGVSIAAAPIYAKHNIAQLAVSTNPKFTDLGYSTTFRLVGNDTLQAKALGAFAMTLKATKFAVLDDGTAYGKGLAEGVIERLKQADKKIVLQQSFDEKLVTADQLAEKLKGAQVDVIVSTLVDFQLLALLEALKKVDYTQLTVLGGDNIKTSTMLKGASIVQSVFATSPILEAREFHAGKKFLESYRASFKADPAYGAHYTYDAMHLVAAAMQKNKSANPELIAPTLKSKAGYAPVTGSMKFDERGEQQYDVIGVYMARGEQWELQTRSDTW